MRTGDGLRRHPLKNFDDGSIPGTHHDRSAVRDQPFAAQWRQMVLNQFEQRLSHPGLGR